MAQELRAPAIAEEERSQALVTPGSLWLAGPLNFSLTGFKADPQSPFLSSRAGAAAATGTVNSRRARKARARPSKNPQIQ